MRKTLMFGVLAITALTFTAPAAALFSGLKEDIQEELDGNPFLEKERIKLRVLEEKNGYVTIEVYEGPRALREAIREGLDIERTDIGLRGAIALRKALAYVKKMKGVKDVIINAAVNTSADRAEELATKATSLKEQKKYAEALVIYRQAADLGNARAQNSLGVMYARGEGVTQDIGEAVKWYRKDAEQGNATAQRNLGNKYRKGKGVTQDVGEAVKWYRKAADQGYASAQNNLAFIYATSPIAKYRNGRQAVAYAQQAVSKEPEKWSFVSTLAAAYARNGEFDKAVTTEEKATRLLKKSTRYSAEKKQQMLEASNRRAELYRQRQPYTETKGD